MAGVHSNCCRSNMGPVSIAVPALSVALNAAFAVLFDVVPQNKAAKSHDLGVRANKIGAHDLASELFLLESLLYENAKRIQNGLFRIIGPFCLVIALVALIFLAISSICYGCHVHGLIQAYAIVQYLPFIIGAGLVITAVIRDSINLTQQLTAFETQLKVLERTYASTHVSGG